MVMEMSMMQFFSKRVLAHRGTRRRGSRLLGRSFWLPALLVALLLSMPLTASAHGCKSFRKQVSVDGGLNWLDADDPASAPSQLVGGGAIYRFIVVNCEAKKDCFDTRITDPDLGIFDVLVPADPPGFLAPGDEIVVTQDDPGFENLDQPDRCDDPGLKLNKATETTTVEGGGEETFADVAYLDCEEKLFCGDGIVQPALGETCDPPGSIPDSPPGNMNECRDDCTYCGDGIVNNGEECDDPNDPRCTDDCRLRCDLDVAKACELPPPPPAEDAECKGKLREFTVIWNGSAAVDLTLGEGLISSSATSAAPGDAVTFVTDGSTNDTIVDIVGVGESTFHVSCSDDDMDGATETNADQGQVSPLGRDCGKDQGNGKDKSGFINQWLLAGFVDDEGDVLDCSPDDGDPADVCVFNAIPASCEFPEKPDVLTFRVSGGDCGASDNDQGPGKTACEGGSIDPSEPVEVSVNGGAPFLLLPGETFDVERSGDPEIELFQGSVTQFNKFHASCSQPLQAGDRYGANELILLDGLGLGTNVTYSYRVRNDGPDTVVDIEVTDDQLGFIGEISLLGPGDSATLTEEAFITETTVNVATVDGVIGGAVCPETESNPVTVEVLGPPPCDVGAELDKLEDDKIKWKLTNGSVFGRATLQTLMLDFPASLGAIKKVKLDGDVFKADDSDTFPDGVPPGGTIGPDDWTEEDVTKRQLEPNETRTLELEFTEKDGNTVVDDFDLDLSFEEGCRVEL